MNIVDIIVQGLRIVLAPLRRSALVTLVIIVTFSGAAQAQDPTPSPDAIPEPVPMLQTDGDILNVMLLGSDTDNPRNSGRTDVIVIVSINYSAGTAALLSIPRDFYAYIPEHGMQRINTAYGYGEQVREGGGPELLAETIAYNLGLKVDRYARVDFNGFRRLIDDLGGVEVAVDCAIQDWRLREPTLDPQIEENWELFTLPIGVQQMDGNLALWYARSRRTSSDFDRGRRHQVILRAMLARLRSLGLLEQYTDIWGQIPEVVETDVTLQDIARMIPLALQMQADQMSSYTFRPNIELRSWSTPEGASVQVPQREAVHSLMQQFLTPPTDLQVAREHPRVEIVNASGFADLSRVAADRLAWEGFDVTISNERAPYQYATSLVDFSGQAKGSSLGVLEHVMRVDDGSVTIAPDAARAVDFRVTLGGNYYACTYNVMVPVEVVTNAESDGS
ncbi:MAG: LCP family protein [Anaerolineae bacterium]|nr:LCP family protein [Anaerolineae bacterium]